MCCLLLLYVGIGEGTNPSIFGKHPGLSDSWPVVQSEVICQPCLVGSMQGKRVFAGILSWAGNMGAVLWACSPASQPAPCWILL